MSNEEKKLFKFQMIRLRYPLEIYTSSSADICTSHYTTQATMIIISWYSWIMNTKDGAE